MDGPGIKNIFWKRGGGFIRWFLMTLVMSSPAGIWGQSAKPMPSPQMTPETTFVVLCYHRFLLLANDRVGWEQAEYQLPVEDFKWQMQYLKTNGFTPISEQQLMDYWFQGKPLPLKPVLITIDDGFRTVYRDAFPILKSYGYPSVFFLYTKFVENGEAAMRRREEDPKKYKLNLGTEALTFEDILEMQKSGMMVEAHTADHPNLGLENENNQ